MWVPFSFLAICFENILKTIYFIGIENWGLVVIIFSLFLKILLFPVFLFTLRQQISVRKVKKIITPKLLHIKKKYKGEEAHNLYIKTHKDLGVSPFYSLKPMIGLFIQIPVLIAIFNVLAEMPDLHNQSFLWIHDLSKNDILLQFPSPIPFVGVGLNLLPFIMLLVTTFFAFDFSDNFLSNEEIKIQKRNLYFMSIFIFILFYPFPSVMVLYWTANNFFQYVQQKFSEKLNLI